MVSVRWSPVSAVGLGPGLRHSASPVRLLVALIIGFPLLASRQYQLLAA